MEMEWHANVATAHTPSKYQWPILYNSHKILLEKAYTLA
jgi:hypothetical protein